MSPAPPTAPLAAPLVALLVCACAAASEIYRDDTVRIVLHNDHSSSSREPVAPEMPPGCMYEGRWYTEGAAVNAREACLRCVCAHGALTCRRRACAPLPDPPPPRCSVLHRRGVCCPELHCPDGVTVTELDGAARFEDTADYTDVDTPAAVAHACVEGGTVYAAGSAMSSGTACEQCFCLGGARRCVRPRCLPPPPACRARPAPGACCPLRYYCDHDSTTPAGQAHPHDCHVEDSWVAEGERVGSAEAGANCSRCFCLRGSVVCQPLACAPALLGCTPLLLPGQCCPHQYHCKHQRATSEALHLPLSLDNGLQYSRIEDRSFHSSKSTKYETSSDSTPTISVTKKTSSAAPATKKTSTTTNKVKRKTNEPSTLPRNATSGSVMSATSTTQKHTTTTKKAAASTEKPQNSTTNKNDTLTVTTEQPETSVRVVINGTINCTTELSSNSLPVNISSNNTEHDQINILSRLPYIAASEAEDHTFNPNDIITDKSVNGGFDENESFVINVTSSLRTNTSGSTLRPSISNVVKIPISLGLPEALNITKKKKGDYDYDNSEPTLPPSLPNLKIIPFVAADAVVEDETAAKEKSTYPILEREDKFPVYYPDTGTKEILFSTRRDDTYMPIYNPDRVDSHYPSLTHEIDLTNPTYVSNHNINNDVSSPLHEYATFTAFDNNDSEAHKTITVKPPSTSFKLETPSMNLFSPPVETEGGFIPKGPENIDDYYNIYQSTPSAPSIPYLTTSMQLDTNIDRGECTSDDGRRVAEGDTISLTCSVCTCAWGELHCSPRPCHTPLGCRRLPASRSLVDLCCGELICDNDGATSTKMAEEKHKMKINETKVVEQNSTESNIKETTTEKTAIKIETLTLSPAMKDTFENISITTENVIRTSTNDSINVENVTNVSPVSLTSTERIISTTPIIETTTNILIDSSNQTKNISQDYEYDEDEGFSLGSVLKLLLSDSYDTTTINPHKRKPVSVPTRPPTTTTTSTTMIPPTSTRRVTTERSVPSFVPMPQQHIPPKKSQQQSPVNRIDHLLLGEATPIRKQTPRPSFEHFKPITTTVKPITASRLTARPTLTTKAWPSAAEEKRKDEHFIGQHMSTAYEVPRPTAASSAKPSAGLGLLKLAGCNIYGRMYGVDRVIAELSTACQECRCTELGVQCRSLNC